MSSTREGGQSTEIMDFSYTDAQESFRDELRVWLEENLPDGWLDGERELPSDDDERLAFLRDWQRTLADGDWAGIHWPEAYGGRGGIAEWSRRFIGRKWRVSTHRRKSTLSASTSSVRR